MIEFHLHILLTNAITFSGSFFINELLDFLLSLDPFYERKKFGRWHSTP